MAAPAPLDRLATLAHRIGRPAAAGWTPPPLAELVARIDGALAERRSG